MEYILRWVDEAVKNKFLALKESTSEDKKLYESIDKTLDKLKFNPYRGESFKKDRIPKIYIRRRLSSISRPSGRASNREVQVTTQIAGAGDEIRTREFLRNRTSILRL